MHDERAFTMRMPEPAVLARLTDPQGRPTFCWDLDLSMAQCFELLQHPELETRAWMQGRVLRELKPEDSLAFLTPQDIADAWPALERHLGRTRDFWAWLLTYLREAGRVH
jgi:hypothetical protein